MELDGSSKNLKKTPETIYIQTSNISTHADYTVTTSQTTFYS